METLNGISLWLEPSGGGGTGLRHLIDRLAEDHGGQSFAPHITLLSALGADEADLLEAAAELAGSEHPFRVSFDKIGLEETYWRTMYMRAEDSDELTRLRARACLRLDVTESLYRPHLSLMYTDLDISSRRRIVANEVDIVLPSVVVIDTLAVVRTEGPVAEWDQIATFQLADRRRPWVDPR